MFMACFYRCFHSDFPFSFPLLCLFLVVSTHSNVTVQFVALVKHSSTLKDKGEKWKLQDTWQMLMQTLNSREKLQQRSKGSHYSHHEAWGPTVAHAENTWSHAGPCNHGIQHVISVSVRGLGRLRYSNHCLISLRPARARQLRQCQALLTTKDMCAHCLTAVSDVSLTSVALSSLRTA